MTEDPVRDRRPPPEFVPVAVGTREELGPRMTRVWLHGTDLGHLAPPEPAASLRLLLPGPDGLVLPRWNGNEFLLPDGRRPAIRTLTPGRVDTTTGALAVDVVLHDGGRLPSWARSADAGDAAAVSGPGRGYDVAGTARRFLLAGDETAIPAITQILAAVPAGAAATVILEIATPDARLPIPDRPGATVRWVERAPGAEIGDALVTAVATTPVEPDMRVWVAGEAAAVQRVRRDLLQARGLPREHCTIRGYWKQGRPGT